MLVSTVAQARRLGFGALAETEGKAMPFDGVGHGFDDRMYKIDRVIDLLATPEQWCKGTLSDTASVPRSWRSMGPPCGRPCCGRSTRGPAPITGASTLSP